LNSDLFARPPKCPISPSELNKEGNGLALVLRYAGCQLRCPLCYAWRYAWDARNAYEYDLDEVITSLGKLKSVAEKPVVWVRIQGGEPLLNYSRIQSTIKYAGKAIKEIHLTGLNYYPTTRAVIQTNALVFNELNSKQIDKISDNLKETCFRIADSGRIIFEISFKSSKNSSILHSQISAYNTLLNKILIPLWESGIDNVALYPIAGLGPSIDFHNTWIIPIENSILPEEVPLFHKSQWAKPFSDLVLQFINCIVPRYRTYDDFRNNPKTNHGKKLAIEEFEPTKFQASWISRYTDKRAQPPIHILLRKTDEYADKQWMSKVLFGRKQEWKNVAKAIPLASNPKKLLELVREMNEYFYPSHPVGHYPYL